MSAQVLIVEDDPMQRQMLETLLRRKLELSSITAKNGQEALSVLDTPVAKNIKLIVMDLNMPVMGGVETLGILKQKYASIPVVILTGSQKIDDAVDAMKKGAVDFITKPYEAHRIAITLKNALKIGTLSKEVSRLKCEKNGKSTFDDLIGYDGGLAKVVQTGRKASKADIPVLITGETGTGKEVFANAIHGESLRAGKTFVAVNCGAIPSQLVESTLFGHEKGAFTGATEKTIGKFREADGGTIFLDEVGELPLDTQVKLLRVLQQKEVEPVGGGKTVPINVRIISATNRNLEEEVRSGNFREDLFFRLNVLQMKLPPLRERKEDIESLAFHFIDRFCADHGSVPKNISQASLKKLQNYDWPGNVRELENTINRAMVMSDDNMLGFDALNQNSNHAENIVPNDHSYLNAFSAGGHVKTMSQIESDAMAYALQFHSNNITHAAKALNIAKSTFYKKMKTYNLNRQD